MSQRRLRSRSGESTACNSTAAMNVTLYDPPAVPWIFQLLCASRRGEGRREGCHVRQGHGVLQHLQGWRPRRGCESLGAAVTDVHTRRWGLKPRGFILSRSGATLPLQAPGWVLPASPSSWGSRCPSACGRIAPVPASVACGCPPPPCICVQIPLLGGQQSLTASLPAPAQPHLN